MQIIDSQIMECVSFLHRGLKPLTAKFAWQLLKQRPEDLVESPAVLSSTKAFCI